ncbi:MAG TPA: ribonuclease R [Alphaproteobacteria bacterium]|nr:ribonuclease R [Alphaproteobacteria bacterium]
MSKKKTGASNKAPMPDRARILQYIEENGGRVSKREIARAFGIRGDDRVALKDLLRDLVFDGEVEQGRGKKLRPTGTLPPVAVLEITGPDPDGELLAKPTKWDEEFPPPRIFLAPPKRREQRVAELGVGERVLARLLRVNKNEYEARIIRRLEVQKNRFVGIYNQLPGSAARLVPTDRRDRNEYAVVDIKDLTLASGDIVLAEIEHGRPSRHGVREARILERFGHIDDARAVSLIVVNSHVIEVDFSEAALDEAKQAKPIDVAGRADLTKIPLITIDPEDARDRDDAVWAEPDDDPANPGGWHVMVAIADVAHYVRPRTALDKDAFARGNSVYFPDRVVPMLPHELSSDLCSLAPGELRGCMVAEMWFDKDGNRKRHKFLRGVMRSAANLNYEQAQAAIDGRPDDMTGPLLEPVLKPLYAAYGALKRERERRKPLDLDMPERKVEIDKLGHVASITPRVRLDAHKLIEEFMIAANVAAAAELESHRSPCLYRIHDRPSKEKLMALGDFLDSIGLKLLKSPSVKPSNFNGILKKVEGTDRAEMVSEIVLRSQAQAEYSPENIGHFGLNLGRYAHFTSPIRRYSDLVVHRALISALDLGGDGWNPEDLERFGEFGEALSNAERKAVAAERDALDRYLAAYLAERTGSVFTGRISGVTRFGLFLTLDETGADGLVPIRSLRDDYYRHDEKKHALVGDRTGHIYRLGERIAARLVEADAITGGMRFELVEGDEQRSFSPPPAKSKRRPPPKGRKPGKPRRQAKRRK